jgi:hypothetical protein
MAVSENPYTTYGQAVSTGVIFDVGNYDRLSVQVNYSTAAHPAVTVIEGVKSRASITVGDDFALLADATAYSTIKVSSNSAGAIGGAVITINGYALTEGKLWNRQDTSTGTAKSLETAINLYTALISTASYGGTSSDTVRSSARAYGAFGNSYTITSSTPAALVLSGATFINGRDRGYISINGTTLYAGLDFAVGASTAATALNIAAAINANTTLAAIVISTANAAIYKNAGVVWATATVSGVNAYALSSSTAPLLTPSGSIFGSGTAGNITSASDLITKANTYSLGTGVWIGATAPTGLTADTTYFVIPVVNTVSFKLSDTSTGAVAGVVLDISTTTAVAGGGSYTLTASSPTVGSTFLLQQSNDRINWITAPSTTTVTVSDVQPVTTLLYDAGALNYRYLRFNFTKPTRGSIYLDIWTKGNKLGL